MNFIWRIRANRSKRGQGMVEFALILPLLVLVLLLAIDLGRVFFGWVSLTNASRVGANYAAIYPKAWEGAGDAAKKAAYLTMVDDNITGCTPRAVPDPVFTDGPDTPTPDKANDVSDKATVTIACDFALITPFISQVVGSTIVLHAESIFPIRTGNYKTPTGVIPGGPPPCTGALVPDLRNRTVLQARTLWTSTGFTGAFTATPNNNTYIVQTQTTTPATAIGACADLTTSVSVTDTAPPACPAGQDQVPTMTGLTVLAARNAWIAKGFSVARFTPTTGQDTQIVLTQSVASGTCLSLVTGSITVTYGAPPPPNCNVPNMVGQSRNAAIALWGAAGFTGTIASQSNGPQVITQNPGHPGTLPCTTTALITMGKP